MGNTRNFGTSLCIAVLIFCGAPEPVKAENGRPAKVRTVSAKLTREAAGATLKRISTVSVVAYNPADSSRCPNGGRGAWASRVEDGDIAISRDLLAEGVRPGATACIDFGRSVHCGVVRDTMSKRYQKHADLAIDKESLTKSRRMAKAFGKRRGVLYICRNQQRLAH